jgi:peptidyl-prolyl cis-trans isomerase A (cyclophilin A)
MRPCPAAPRNVNLGPKQLTMTTHQPRRRQQTLGASLSFSVAMAAIGLACCKKDTPPEPVSADPALASSIFSSSTSTSPGGERGRGGGHGPRRAASNARARTTAKPVASVAPAEDDPLKGRFTLAEATKDLKGQGPLLADISVEIPGKAGARGDTAKLTCALFDDRAPLTVANFVGLARGLRPWKNPDGKWVTKPAYDGTHFHRIVKGFMIQGGDPVGNGTGEPGYVIPDEVWEGADHDRAGLLCMANRGKNTNGAQFFITDAAAPHLDGGYTIFGECAPLDDVRKISGVEVRGERPVSVPKIKKISVRRGPSPVPLPAGSTSAGSSSSAAPPGSAGAGAPRGR